MKLWSSKNSDDKSNGMFICCKIGRQTLRSYWTSPPTKLIADYQYLKGRYGFINTKQRAQRFIELYNVMFWEITDFQMKKMKHAIGLDHSNKPYRNRYFTNKNDKDWNYLVEIGAAVKGKNVQEDGSVSFRLTKQGVEFALGKRIRSKAYEDL